LVLRLVDLLLPGESRTAPDVFLYQASATERYAREMDVDSPEKALLLSIIKGARDTFTVDQSTLMTPALFAYGHYLEETSRYEEALDVLRTLVDLGRDKLAARDAIATTLRIARVLRKLAHFDEAYASYEEAGSLALVTGDVYSELLSRIGRVNIVWNRGNLAEAEAGYRQLIEDARAAHQTDAEARATDGLASTLGVKGRPAEAIPFAWRAFELYEDCTSKNRALVGLGILLRDLGDLDAAEQAFRAALARTDGTEHSGNAVLELIECASLRGDRFGYARWREEARRRESGFTPSMRVDFLLKQGLADARFGSVERGQEHLQLALALAQQHKLHEYVFRIDGLKQNLRELDRLAPAEVAEGMAQESVEAVRAGLRELVAAD
jgi:tetratricopeptide (TPR) repeat protein